MKSKHSEIKVKSVGTLLKEILSILPFKLRWILVIFFAGFFAFPAIIIPLSQTISAFGGEIVWSEKSSQNDKEGLKCKEGRVVVDTFDQNEECILWRNNFGLDALVFLDDEKNIVRPNLTENFSTGREVFLEKKFGSDNQISLEAIPQSGEKVNVSINYGSQWRVIIGDGDYNSVKLQVNSKYPKENLSTDDWVTVPELSGKNWIFPNRGLEPRKKISIIVRSQAKEGSNIVDVDVTVKGFLKGGDRSEDFNFHYSVSMMQKASESFERIGFGLLDPHRENIATMLQYFEVIPLSRYHAQ